MWEIKEFSELTTQELFDLMYIRVKTFVVEQERIYQEVDDNDLTSIHIFKYEGKKIIAYARVFREDGHITFGRIVAAKDHRGTGLGAKLVEEVLRVINDKFPDQNIEIEAQTYVEGFYKKFGFKSVGDVFLFNHTPHIKMIKNHIII
ncbi:GNAT family N-acetyltransferase [Companilactobacillus allii]|uniref:GNAT family N-acetyltransferase n=2 Tax=Companilactobacillus allii TaxID=1847728 RepID=A0A1P8Q4Q4_9LACO|nr:GNAT family N-acetyltransferase [Companilactobacillus allii]APX72840.1 GNAT family N-acetyltransferase [Companilactobacillus allii]USQ67628.1 GNAT family N-acetyltransferase [Companilactobacillus allii]